MLDVVGIGASVYDTLMMLSAYPQEDTKAQGLRTLVQGGGPCATALVAMARLGIAAGYMGTVGDDAFGRFMLADLDKHGVSTEHARRIPDAVSYHAVIWLSQETASRTCVWNPGTAPPLAPSQVDEPAVLGAKVLHLDGHMLEAAIYAARLARSAGVKVSYDAGGTYPGVERLLPLVDFLIPSEEYALKMTGEQTAEAAALALHAEHHPEIVVVTQGARGGILCRQGEISRYPAFPVDVADSNGAGDVFHGAFVAGYLKGLPLSQCAVYASAVSAIKCTRFGAREGIPSDGQARAFLAQRGVALEGGAV